MADEGGLAVPLASYISPKCVKGRVSGISGRGLFALAPIEQDEVVAIKGGHIVDRATLLRESALIGEAYIQIEDGFYLAPLTAEEVEPVMLFLNHSCEPNVGLRGNVVFVAMRAIAAGEELVMDYAMFDDDPEERMDCRCGALTCRRVVSGTDWQRPELQRRYGRYFSSYLLRKIEHL
jgi:SET domain-containing protein